MINPWKVLGVHRKSSDAEIRDAYYSLAKTCHPDVAGRKQDIDKFIDVKEAYAKIETVAARRKFLDTCLGGDCSACRGSGTITKSKGISGKVHKACTACGGAGVIIKEKEDGTRAIELRGAKGIGSDGRDKGRRGKTNQRR